REGGVRPRSPTRAPALQRRVRSGRRRARGPGPLRRHHRQRRCPHALRLVPPRRPRRLRGSRRRAPPLQPRRPGALAPHLGREPGGRRYHQRLWWTRVSPGRRCGRRIVGTMTYAHLVPTDFPTMDVAGRLTRLQHGLAESGCDGLVVSSLTNIRYLTGFTGSAGLLVVLADDAVLITDGRYGVQAPEQLAASGARARVEVAPGPRQREAAVAAVGRLARLGLEAAHVSWAQQRAYAGEWFPGFELVPTVGLVEGLRRVKDPGELARM